jgi:ABC-type molybdate transport system substrate-binding protein
MNWDTVWIPILVALPGLIAAVIAYLASRTTKKINVAVDGNLTKAMETIAVLRGNATADAVTIATGAAALDTEKARNDGR